MHEGVWFQKEKKIQYYSCENLDNSTLILLLYMHSLYQTGAISRHVHDIILPYFQPFIGKKKTNWTSDISRLVIDIILL